MSKRFLMVLMSLTLMFSFSSTTFASANIKNSSSDCPSCSGDKPDSTGSEENIDNAKNILFSSDNYKSEEDSVDGDLQKNDVIVNAPEAEDDGLNSAFVTVPVKNSDDHLNNIVFTVDLKDKEVSNVRETYLNIIDDKQLNLTIIENGEVVGDFTLNPKQVQDNITSSTEPYQTFIDKQKQQDDVQVQSTCRDLVAQLTGAAGAAQCYLLCTEIGLANGFAGLGCGVICTIALAVPLSDAADKICS